MRTRQKNTEIYKRISVMLLSALLTVSMLPLSVFAENTDSAEDADPAETVTAQGLESTDEEGLISGLEMVRPEVTLPDSDELLGDYLQKQISEETGVELNYDASSGAASDNESQEESGELKIIRKSAKLVARRNKLSTAEKEAYDRIKVQITQMASGELSRAYVAVPYNSTVDYELVINALMTDMPYEFYWYDKTFGYLCGTTGSGNYVFYFSVSKDYWDTSVYYSGYDIVYGLNTIKTSATQSAIVRVRNIVNKYSGYTDLNKLYAYRDEICSLTSYNYSAANASSSSGGNPFYGDPWQLIYVFDGDSSTNVVCEGYSKAFQLLCDLSEFDTIQSHMVSGGLNSTTSNHMWNIIQMDDGYNYIADITNYDGGHSVFLTGYTSKSGSRYYYGDLWYYYDNETRQLYTDAELALSGSAYSTDNPKIHHHPEVPKTCYSSGIIEYWEYWDKPGTLYRDVNCTETITEADLAIPAGHDMTEWSYEREPTCTENGVMERHCTGCSLRESKSLPALGHTWSDWVTVTEPTYSDYGYRQRICSECGVVDQQTIDRLGTSISEASISGIKAKTYTGKAIKQTPVVKVGGVRLVKGTDYTLSYKNNKNVGKATVVIKGKGKYYGSVSRTFKIRPKKTAIKTPKASRKAIRVKWKKQSAKMSKSRITGYQVQIARDKSFKKNKKTVMVKGYKKVSRKITGLKAKKKYYVRVRTYKTVNGKKYYSAWSKVKAVRTR